MPKKNRAYKKGAPFRDASLVLIVAEGKREEAYFRFFQNKSKRLILKIVDQEEDRSAPGHFLDRLRNFLEAEEITIESEDQVWFVLDVDNWPRTSLNTLFSACEQESNWHIAISNPCFEVWLLFHFKSNPGDPATCQELKRRLHSITLGGSAAHQCGPFIEQALERAKQADRNKQSHFPDTMQTKVYKIADVILQKLGPAWTKSI